MLNMVRKRIDRYLAGIKRGKSGYQLSEVLYNKDVIIQNACAPSQGLLFSLFNHVILRLEIVLFRLINLLIIELT